MDTDNENNHQQKHSHKITKSHFTSTPHPDNNPTSTDQPSILPSIASTCIRQRQRAGKPKEKLANLLILNPGWKWVWMLYECSAACRSDPDPASWPLSPGKGLDLHGALSSAAPVGHEGWGGAGVRVRLLPFGAVLNPRSSSAWLVRTWVVDTVWTDDACYN